MNFLSEWDLVSLSNHNADVSLRIKGRDERAITRETPLAHSGQRALTQNEAVVTGEPALVLGVSGV